MFVALENLPCFDTQDPPGQGKSWSFSQQRLFHFNDPPAQFAT